MRKMPMPSDGESFDALIDHVCAADKPIVVNRPDSEAVVLMTHSHYRDLFERSNEAG